MAHPAPRRVLIVGSGFSGLCLAIQLKRAGLDDFTLLEKGPRLGGTWRDNTYPGAACDVPSFAYCFSFEQKTDWSRKWSSQEEILAYMEHCASRYGLGPHLRFDTEVARARFDASDGLWHVTTVAGEELSADILVSGVGQLNRPFVPDVPGLDRFDGEWFHSAQWNHDFDLSQKRVAVIGNAATAGQFIPEIAPKAGHLTIFQRSANWVLPKNDREYSEAEKRRFERYPLLAKLYRWYIWSTYERLFPVFRRNERLGRRVRDQAIQYLEEHVSDPELRRALTPDYPIGAKRILFLDDYFQVFQRDHVELVTEGIERIAENGVVTRDGKLHPADALIFATGFQSTEFLAPMEIVGLEGRRLEEAWSQGAEAYLGMTVAGFPNFFLMYGPNTNLGHNSIIFMIECQARYILACIQRVFGRGLGWLDLDPGAMAAFNRRLEQEFERMVWAAVDRSWYKREDGRITNNWSGSTIRYWWETRRPDFSHYREAPRPGGSAEGARAAA